MHFSPDILHAIRVYSADIDIDFYINLKCHYKVKQTDPTPHSKNRLPTRRVALLSTIGVLAGCRRPDTATPISFTYSRNTPSESAVTEDAPTSPKPESSGPPNPLDTARDLLSSIDVSSMTMEQYLRSSERNKALRIALMATYEKAAEIIKKLPKSAKRRVEVPDNTGGHRISELSTATRTDGLKKTNLSNTDFDIRLAADYMTTDPLKSTHPATYVEPRSVTVLFSHGSPSFTIIFDPASDSFTTIENSPHSDGNWSETRVGNPQDKNSPKTASVKNVADAINQDMRVIEGCNFSLSLIRSIRNK